MSSTWGRTPSFGAQTPMVGSMTPSYGSMTPMTGGGGGGGRTPMYGSQTPMHGDGKRVSQPIRWLDRVNKDKDGMSYL